MILTTIQSLEPPVEPFLDWSRLGARQALREEFFKAGLGTGLEKEGACKGPSPLLLPALHPLPHRGTKSWQEIGPAAPELFVQLSSHPQATGSYIPWPGECCQASGHPLDPVQNQQWVGGGRLAVLFCTCKNR